MLKARKRLGGAMLVSALAMAATGCAEQSDTGGSAAEDFPAKEVRYVIPFDPGGESDITARLQQQALEKALGQPVVVSNRPGGGGSVGWSELANGTPADGYTVMGANLPHTLLQPLARDDAGYKTEDLKWVYIFESTPNAFVVPKDSPYNSIQDFVDAAKNETLTVGGSSDFSANHMGTLALNEKAGIELTYVPFSGTAAAAPALLGGQVNALMTYNTEALELQDQGAKVLAVASEERLDELPDVPTFKEEGLDVIEGAWRGVAVPPDTPDEIVNRLADAFEQVNQDPQVREKMTNLGFHIEDMGPQEAADFISTRQEEARQLLQTFGLIQN
ncbi:tripartite tricarboxylate transporter substrate binding protein [Amycolatopsis palatopharyngis]|uniref:tripartite tricarboxylate transporter substrate binding protein n=1 Tax=Amycolatopsis palatopharyngis TaxID=187982 RepID=UPI0013BE9AC7|nr:tripartite tricarboxylate transporter substrate binding protein [Amycolatopsis palatopharyngis]